jgi:hypothetical protein
MEEIVKNSKILNTRSIFVSLIIAGVVTGGNLWIHNGDPKLGYSRYMGYGLSFDYDPFTEIREQDLTGYGLPTDDEGTVTALTQSNELLKQWGVFWIKPEIMPSYIARNPMSAIDLLFENAEMTGTKVVDRSDYSISIIGGYEVFHQYFGIQESGITIPGVIGAWYSKDQSRYVIFYLVYIESLETLETANEDIELLWYNTLDSIKFVEIEN